MVAASIYIFYYCNYEVMKNRKVDSKSMGHGEGGGGVCACACVLRGVCLEIRSGIVDSIPFVRLNETSHTHRTPCFRLLTFVKPSITLKFSLFFSCLYSILAIKCNYTHSAK